MTEDRYHTITISKLDAARRQLQTAITLWFNGGDPVATHSLAYAAYEIIHALSKKRNPNRRDLLFDSAQVGEAERKDINVALKSHANFFKHGDRDAEAVIDFKPALTEGFLVFAIVGFELCGESSSDEFIVFKGWMRLQKPGFMAEAERKTLEERMRVDQLTEIRALPKHEFFQATMNALRMSKI
jgi:hypothetical protein